MLGAGRAKANCSSLRRESLKVIIAIIVNVGVVFIVLIVFIIVPSTVIIICVATIINTEVKWVFLMALVMVMIKRMMGKTMESWVLKCSYWPAANSKKYWPAASRGRFGARSVYLHTLLTCSHAGSGKASEKNCGWMMTRMMMRMTTRMMARRGGNK